MKSHLTFLAALGLLLPAAAFAQAPAGAGESPSAFTLPAAEYASLEGGPDGVLGGFVRGVPTTYEAIRYRPRREHRSRGYLMPVVSQLHAGFYDPSGDPTRGFLFGFRGGPMVDPHVQLGLAVDWEHKSDRVSAALGTGTIPGVGDVTVTDERLRARTDFIPILGFIQIGGDDRMAVAPYAGVGGGYEVLSVEADMPDGTRFEGTYGGWGWQVWGGAAVPLSGQSRLFGEVFYNQAELGRDVEDPYDPGRILRESVDFNGSGLRLGLSWGF